MLFQLAQHSDIVVQLGKEYGVKPLTDPPALIVSCQHVSSLWQGYNFLIDVPYYVLDLVSSVDDLPPFRSPFFVHGFLMKVVFFLSQHRALVNAVAQAPCGFLVFMGNIPPDGNPIRQRPARGQVKFSCNLQCGVCLFQQRGVLQKCVSW